MMGYVEDSEDFASLQKEMPEFKPFDIIHLEQPDSCASDIRAANDQGTIASEMRRPNVLPWVKESGHVAGIRVQSCQIGPLVTVAEQAGHGQIVHVISA
jgi:hypothetical protein